MTDMADAQMLMANLQKALMPLFRKGNQPGMVGALMFFIMLDDKGDLRGHVLNATENNSVDAAIAEVLEKHMNKAEPTLRIEERTEPGTKKH